ncbi:MAG: DUF4369 domain-containing protein [Dysgonamonadaceae bacterium]|jgi:uncharacterized protein (TIGR02145 family)|nr:DUF4369 domain-containing protein [Dysgonamonadaceae bacterium]
MLKRSLIIVLCLLQLLLLSCKNETGVTIKGEISNLESPYILVSYISADTLAVGTVLVKNNRGRFTYNATIDTTTVVTLFLNDFQSSVVIFADKGERISVKGDAQIPDLIRIRGSEVNEELTSFKLQNEELLRQRRQLIQNLERFEEMVDSNKTTSHTMAEEMLRINAINQELTLRAEEFIEENPTKLSSVILVNDFFTDSDNSEGLERVLNLLEGDVLLSQLARRLKVYSEKITSSAEGAYIPYFQLTGIENDTIISHKLPEKYTLLSFVSTNGIASREMVKSLKHSYEILGKDTIRFISIYIDADTFPVTHLESDSIPWTVVAESNGWNSQIVDAFNIQFVPFNILISPNRIISERNILPQRVVELVSPEKFDTGVVINGIRWATRNVNASGTFANNPEDSGMFFQWNRRRAWNATDENVRGWNHSVPTGTKWEKENDPCPVGWRVPTKEELQSLNNVGSEWTIRNDVNGRLFGTASNQIFLPVAGWRANNNGTLLHTGEIGYYWSSAQSTNQNASFLWLLNDSGSMSDTNRASGFSIRCVSTNN